MRAPASIGVEASNVVQRSVQDMVPGEIDKFFPEIVVSYATGRRDGDAPGTGPGMYYTAALIHCLFGAGFPCFSGLQIPSGENWRIFMLRKARQSNGHTSDNYIRCETSSSEHVIVGSATTSGYTGLTQTLPLPTQRCSS